MLTPSTFPPPPPQPPTEHSCGVETSPHSLASCCVNNMFGNCDIYNPPYRMINLFILVPPWGRHRTHHLRSSPGLRAASARAAIQPQKPSLFSITVDYVLRYLAPTMNCYVYLYMRGKKKRMKMLSPARNAGLASLVCHWWRR